MDVISLTYLILHIKTVTSNKDDSSEIDNFQKDLFFKES